MLGNLKARLTCHESFINTHGLYYVVHKKYLVKSLKNKQFQFLSQQNSDDNNTFLAECNEICYIDVETDKRMRTHSIWHPRVSNRCYVR